MQRYRYQDGFEGFLCAVSHCLAAGVEPAGFLCGDVAAEADLFAETVIEIATDRQTALQFREKFIQAVSQPAFATARYAFHSRQPDRELLLWRYFKLGFRVGKRMPDMLAERDVATVDRLGRGVAHEAHKYKGFVRFREVTQGFLYARIEPQADILPFLAPHFVQRVGDRHWMIHDIGRSEAAIYDLRQWRLLQGVELSETPEYTQAEEECAGLWQHYFKRMAIKERHNPRLQQQHVPLRSRSYLLEFEQQDL